MAFDLKDYEPVKSRKRRFYEQFNDGRIIVECMEANEACALFKASIYKTVDDQRSGLPLATGFAQEFKGLGGVANRNSWVENCEESAIGRALDNGGFSGDLKCSREEMKKVQAAQLKETPIGKAIESSKDYLVKISELAKKLGYSGSDLKKISFALFKCEKSSDLTIAQLKQFVSSLKESKKETLIALAEGKLEKDNNLSDSIPNCAPTSNK